MQYLILCAFSFDSLKKISNFEADYKRTERYGRFKKENERRMIRRLYSPSPLKQVNASITLT